MKNDSYSELMNIEEALNAVDAAVFAKKKRHLKDVERVIFKGTWLRQNYYEIAAASDYTATYLKQDIGPKFWKLLTEVLGEPVSKTNLQAPVEREWQRQQATKGQQEESFTPKDAARFSNGNGTGTSSSEVSPPQQLIYVSGSNKQIKQAKFNHRNFVGRHKEMDDLNTFVSQGAKIVLIRGEGGIGKSWLSWEYLTSERFDLTLELWMAKETQNITSAKSVAEEWLRQHFNEEPRGDFSVTLEQLRQKLRDRTRRVGVLIDNLEPALDKYGKFIPAHRDYVELLTVLADPAGNCLTLITSRERLGESAVAFEDYRLEGLDESAWKQFFKNRNIKSDSPGLSAMHQAYGGNAKAMHIICGVIKADWSGDIEEYWQVNKKNLLNEIDLQDLVVSQFQRLQELDPDAYKLLCRLGCYRYQDVRGVLLDGIICLLWDIPESQHRRAVKSLRDRSLVDFLKGEYWLHPVIRAEARARLKLSEDWKIVNHKAAELWANSVQRITSIPEALKVLEAAYHYIDIGEYELASDLIIKERRPMQNHSQVGETLSGLFGRLGIVQHIISVLNLITEKISNGYYLSQLYFWLGNLHQRAGDIEKSMEIYRHAIEIAGDYQKLIRGIEGTEEIRTELDAVKLKCFLILVFAKQEMGEQEGIVEAYEQILSLAPGTIYAMNSLLGLALIYSKTNSEESKKKAYACLEQANKIHKELPANKIATWTKAYRLYGLSMTFGYLGEYETAIDLYRRTIAYTEENHFTTIKGQALNGLAVVYRNKGDFEKAIGNHEEALKILAPTEARSNTAEIYYELGLTYQKMGEMKKSKRNFQEAIKLYEQMKAPKQIDKVQRAIEAYV